MMRTVVSISMMVDRGDLVKMQEDRGFSNNCVMPLVSSSFHLVLIHLRVGISMSRLR